MKNLPGLVAASILFAAFALSGGCAKRGQGTEEFLIHVDSITHPDTVAARQKFAIRFYGNIGSDGCSQFLRFETESQADQLRVWTVGVRNTDPQQACPEYVPMLDGAALSVVAPDSGYLHVSVINPGLGKILKSKVVIRTSQ